jgi:hypothetical protein
MQFRVVLFFVLSTAPPLTPWTKFAGGDFAREAAVGTERHVLDWNIDRRAQVLAQRLNLNFAFAPEFQELGQSSAEQPAYHGNAILTSLPIRSTRMLRLES